MKNYQICVFCIMDSTDPNIIFDSSGTCAHCQNFNQVIASSWVDGNDDNKKLAELGDRIRQRNKGRDFDCIIGLSGGLDSSYTAHVAVEKMRLRPLLFHVDAGWNTDKAVGNIEKLMDGLELDLYTDVVNWNAVRDMQLAFLRSGIPDQDLVQDAAFFSGLYKFAREYDVKHVLTGSNFSTECCREPEAWGGYLGIDATLFNDIWSKFGQVQSNYDFPVVDIMVYKIWYQRILGMKIHHPLNLVHYRKAEAENELSNKYGWESFKHKHHESRFTRFYEDYWLPKRFGFQKRRAHFSSLIMTNQMTREEALERIKKPEMDEFFLQKEFSYIASKLEIDQSELVEMFELPKKSYADYKNKQRLIQLGVKTMRALGLERRKL
jgi:putative aminotransferase